jgi:hypothetical protein
MMNPSLKVAAGDLRYAGPHLGAVSVEFAFSKSVERLRTAL